MVTICVRGVAVSGTGGCGAESSVERASAGGGAGGFLPGTSTMSAAATMASATAATLKRILLLLLNGPASLQVRAVDGSTVAAASVAGLRCLTVASAASALPCLSKVGCELSAVGEPRDGGPPGAGPGKPGAPPRRPRPVSLPGPPG